MQYHKIYELTLSELKAKVDGGTASLKEQDEFKERLSRLKPHLQERWSSPPGMPMVIEL